MTERLTVRWGSFILLALGLSGCMSAEEGDTGQAASALGSDSYIVVVSPGANATAIARSP